MHQASKTSKRALNDSSSRQEDKAALGFGQFGHFQTNAVLAGLFRRNIVGIALVHKGNFDIASGYHFLDPEALTDSRRVFFLFLKVRCQVTSGEEVVRRLSAIFSKQQIVDEMFLILHTVERRLLMLKWDRMRVL